MNTQIIQDNIQKEIDEYYTTVEKNKRKIEEAERKEKIQSLIGGLNKEELQLLEVYFQDRLNESV